jgi:hypothetical protein
VHKREGQENGYGRYCNHNLRRALPCTPPDVAVLFSAGYLTLLTPGNERRRALQARRPASGFSKTRSRPGRDILTFPLLPAAQPRRMATSSELRSRLCATAREHAISWQ